MSKVKLPHLPLWVYDIDADEACALMLPETFGIYMRLLMRQWMEGSIPADRSAILMLLRLPSERYSECLSDALRKFEEHPDEPGRLINLRLDDERRHAVAKVEKNRLSGRKGGSSKANAKADGVANAKANAKATGCIRASDSDSDSISSLPESARGKSFGALKRALGREISTGDEYKLVQYQNTLPDRITIHGDAIDSWALIERALSEAAAHGNCQSAKGAVAYVKSVVERCIQHECWPGEFPDAKSAPAKTHKIPLGTG